MKIEEKHPLSESTLRRHGYRYGGLNYAAIDCRHPSEYYLSKDGKDLNVMVKYWRGRLLATYELED
jgi:hypothetical protein